MKLFAGIGIYLCGFVITGFGGLFAFIHFGLIVGLVIMAILSIIPIKGLDIIKEEIDF